MFGSYNKFHHKVSIQCDNFVSYWLTIQVHVTATVISSLDFVTSIIAGVVIFSIMGALSKETGVPLDKVGYANLP